MQFMIFHGSIKLAWLSKGEAGLLGKRRSALAGDGARLRKGLLEDKLSVRPGDWPELVWSVSKKTYQLGAR